MEKPINKKKLDGILKKHDKWVHDEKGGERADLSHADLFRANLSGANLSGANLFGSDLSHANLSGSDLSGANLSGANLFRANLSGSDLSHADLFGANLSGSDLSGANLSEVKNADVALARTRITPDGEFEGWKKCEYDVIVRLRIPADAKRSNATGRKCRAEFVKVLEVINGKYGISTYDYKTEYRKGKIVKCDKWSDNRWEECAGGIHFYLTREEAIEHK